jgi:hypothetical protein
VTTVPPLPVRYAGNPVLVSTLPVIAHSDEVGIDADRLRDVAGWMAYEELPLPQYLSGFPLQGGPDDIIDFTMLATCIDFAFTDFSTGERFQVDYAGTTWSDSDALFACLRRALDNGIPILDAGHLTGVSDDELAQILAGSIRIPMLAERAAILRAVGAGLAQRFGGRFSTLVRSAAPRLHTPDATGIVDQLTGGFPRFDDVSDYLGHRVRFDKLAQLAVWIAHTSVGGQPGLPLEDLDQMTAFADYIVPVGLELLGILRYSDDLTAAIVAGEIIPRDSAREVQIRAHTVYAVALLTEAINQIRPPDRQIVMAQVDARLWTHYHTTFRRHHLTPTVMY